MAKKVRGGRSTHRPGGMGPSRARKASDGAATTSTLGAGDRGGADIERALESVLMDPEELVLAEDAAVVAPAARKPRRGARTRADSLDARVAAENVYVAEDLRRIGLITAGLVVALLVAWLLLVPLNLAGLY